MAYTSEQHGKNLDVYFAYNNNTVNFWETDYFPLLIDNAKDILTPLRDYIDNADMYGEYDADQTFILMLSNGEFINVGDLDPKAARKKLLNKFVKPQFIIWDNAFDTQFYVSDFEALNKLQEYTGWFDMDIYYDWI